MRFINLMLIFVFISSAAIAAQQYYQFPTTTTIPDNSRILMYDGTTSKNITGIALKQELSAFAHLSTSRRIADANQVFNLMSTANSTKLIKRAATDANDYARIMEIKNQSGMITSWINAKGQMIFGTPHALAVTGVYPANGATGLPTKFDPYIDFNKVFSYSISTLYIVGNTTNPVVNIYDGDHPARWTFQGFSGAVNTTYTIKAVRPSAMQTDGETTSSCGTYMSDVAGVCTSTFTTGQ